MADKTQSSRERKILVGVDQGEESMYALSWCLDNVVSENSNDTLVLLYAKPTQNTYGSGGGGGGMDGTGYLFSSDILATMERYRNAVAESVMAAAMRRCKQLDGRIKVETIAEDGDARDVICQVAEKLGVDLVVVGTHGYGAIKRAFLGSVSNHCAQNAKCPVLIVKRPKS